MEPEGQASGEPEAEPETDTPSAALLGALAAYSTALVQYAQARNRLRVCVLQ
jgi:hypothetical protein